MSAWAWVAIYIAGMAFAFRPLYGHIHSSYDNDWGDIAFNVFITTYFCAIGWPFILLWSAFMKTVGRGDPNRAARFLGAKDVR